MATWHSPAAPKLSEGGCLVIPSSLGIPHSSLSIVAQHGVRG